MILLTLLHFFFLQYQPGWRHSPRKSVVLLGLNKLWCRGSLTPNLDRTSTLDLPTPARRRRPNTSMVVTPELVEGHVEPEASEPASYVGTWHSELAVCKSGAANPSLWDVDFPFNKVLNQVSTLEDTATMEHLGIHESLQAMRSYSLWASALANSTEKLCRGQHDHYVKKLQSLRSKVDPLEKRCVELENLYNRATRKLERAKSDLQTSIGKYQALEKEKSEIQSLLVSAQEERDKLQAKISELTSQGVVDYDNGFQEDLDQVHEKFSTLDLDEIHPD